MKRKFPNHPGLRRAGPSRLAKPKLVIVCEGKVTEPAYFDELSRLAANPLVEVTTIRGCGVPMSVVERAIAERERLVREARRSRDSYDLAFQVWAVFDVDEHPRRIEAEEIARRNDVLLAVSNPCFEIWGLAHFVCPGRPMNRSEAQRALTSSLPDYDHARNPRLSAIALEPRRIQAIENARRCLASRQQEGIERGNPSTEVFSLVEQIFRWSREV